MFTLKHCHFAKPNEFDFQCGFFFTRFSAKKGGVVSTNRAIGKLRFHIFPLKYLTQSPFVTSWFLLIVVAFTSINMSSELFYPVFGSFMKDFADFTQHQRVITVSCVVGGLKCAQCDMENFQIFQCAGVSIFLFRNIFITEIYMEKMIHSISSFLLPLQSEPWLTAKRRSCKPNSILSIQRLTLCYSVTSITT